MGWDPTDYEVTLVDSLDECLDFREWLGRRRDWLGCDIETSGLNLGCDVIRMAQFGDEKKGWSIPWNDWAGLVKEAVGSYRGRIAFHNAAFDLGFFERDGVHLRQEQVHDTMVMGHLLEPRRAIGLKPLAAKHVSPAAMLGKTALTDLFKSSGWSWPTVPVDHPTFYIYAAMDTSLTAALAAAIHPRVEEAYHDIYEVEMACLFVLRNARIAGLQIDVPYTVRKRAELVSDIEGLNGRFPFAPTKDAEVKAWLEAKGQERGYGHSLESWWPFRTEEENNVSLRDQALAYFEDRFPDVIPPLREFRKKYKLVHSYFDNMLGFEVGGVLRCNIKTLGARTGRMSIDKPALQQLPRGRVVKDGFVAREGCKLVLADYSQMEARMLAADAGCQPMLDAFARGEDLHAFAAAMCFHGGDMEAVTKQQRQTAKSVNYAKAFCAGDATIAATAKVPISEIEDFQERYDVRFPEIGLYIDTVINEVAGRMRAEGDGYVHTVLGRRLPVDKNRLYSGVNYRIQGSGGDVLKLKLVELDNAGLGQYIRLPVHDECVMEAPDEDVDDVLRVTRSVMPEIELFSCPLTIDTDVVERWGEHYEEEDAAKRGHWAENEGWQRAEELAWLERLTSPL